MDHRMDQRGAGTATGAVNGPPPRGLVLRRTPDEPGYNGVLLAFGEGARRQTVWMRLYADGDGRIKLVFDGPRAVVIVREECAARTPQGPQIQDSWFARDAGQPAATPEGR